MTIIVNLSSTHSWDIRKSFAAFAKIHKEHSSSCFSCSSTLHSMSSYAWVLWKYRNIDKTCIQPYKLGKMDSDQFLQELATIFDFVDEEKLTLTGKSKLDLLEEAWNAAIGLDDNVVSRFSALIERAKTELVYLVSNTNPLNVKSVFEHFKQQNPNILFINFDLKHQQNNTPIEIMPNVYLCPSYAFQCFKTSEQNALLTPPSTMSLIEYVIKDILKSPLSEIKVVSQYDGDLKEAEKLGIPCENIHHAHVYFQNDILEIKNKR